MRFAISRVSGDGKVVKLELQAPERLAALQQRIADLLPLQRPIAGLHVTLGHADTTGPFPDPPDAVETLDVPEAVTEGTEASVYLRLTDASAQAVADYVRRAAAALGRPGLVEHDRVFHVSVTNLTGEPGASVAEVWKCRTRRRLWNQSSDVRSSSRGRER
jgi:hypothetical protein